MKKINLSTFSKLLFLTIILLINDDLFCQSDSAKIQQDTTVAINDKHPQDMPPNSGFELKADDGNSYLRIKGSVRLNGAYDFNGLQSKSTFSTYDIPVGNDNSNEPRFFMSAYQSRFALEIYKYTFIGNVFGKIEADFEGTNNNLRLRFAYAVIENFLAGKARSVFGDAEAIPKTVDREGPNSAVNEKAIQIRFEPPEVNYWRYAFALETPNPDFTNVDTVDIQPFFQSFPDVTGRIKFGNDESWGHLQLATVFRSITVRNPNEELQVLAGYGGLFSGSLDFSKLFSLKFQIVGGKGIASYIKALSGTGQDGVFDIQQNSYKLLTTYGGFASLNHKWNRIFSSQLISGSTYVVNLDSQPPDAFNYSYYFSFNSFANISKIINIGLEYSYGERIDKNNERGNANRISFISIVDF